MRWVLLEMQLRSTEFIWACSDPGHQWGPSVPELAFPVACALLCPDCAGRPLLPVVLAGWQLVCCPAVATPTTSWQ
jgi:hypothetical protein